MTAITQVKLILNGIAVNNDVEPRTSLADFVRDHHDLTGTNLGCEQGVCGACTLLVDESPVRSCLVRAATCSGSNIRTIESFDHDEVMMQLREAFTTHHALQCGYCTPGMLATARDIVLRLPEADETLIRLELAGNLCRCTGYTGIVQAIASVLNIRKENILVPTI
jgi:carbon-monoxide dehydrogenase small subunit